MTDPYDAPYHTRKMPELSDAETDALSAQVNQDLQNGNATKHFEDVLDELNSTQARPTNEPDAHDRDEERRMCLAVAAQLKRDATRHLLSHGMRVEHVRESDGHKGYTATMRDREGRQFEAHITWDEANRPDGDGHALYLMMVDAVVERALLARKTYFARMCLTVEGNALPETGEKG